jgi:hypothetical protein
VKGPDALPAHEYNHLRRVRLPDAPDTFDFKRIPDAYEYLLLDVLLGDDTVFIRDDVIELSWRGKIPRGAPARNLPTRRGEGKRKSRMVR